MFDHTHYVPVLKSKQGELWALENLSDAARESVTPLLEFLPHKKNSVKAHAAELCESLTNAWGTERPFFIDGVHLQATSGSGQLLEQVFAATRHCKLQAIPVTSIGRSKEFQSSVQRIVNADNRGAMIRLNARDFVASDRFVEAIQGLTNFLKLTPEQIDIFIDYGPRTDSAEIVQFARIHIAAIPNINKWRTLTIGSGAFPPSIKQYDEWHKLPREEWGAWIETMSSNPPLSRLPSYSDYTIRDPGIPPDRGSASANLRYTTDLHYFVKCGKLVKHGGAESMPALCRSLMEKKEYKTEAFSVGDSEIARISTNQRSRDKKRKLQTGNAGQWTQWCMNHHIEFVVDQMQKLFAA
jgi:hypothetical protein